MKNGMNSKWRDFLGTILMLLGDIKEWFEKNKKSIITWFMNVVFVFSTFFVFGWWSEEDFLMKFTGWIFLYLLYFCIMALVNYVDRKNMPRLRKRLTLRDQNGNIKIRGDSLHEAILFLYDVEEYIYK